MVMSRKAAEMLAEDMVRFYADPLGYVMYVFPWGKAGSPLEKYDGPRKWQKEFLQAWGVAIKERNFDFMTAVAPILFSVSSGHGIGKSCISAWIIKFILDTRPFCKGVVTANTSDQLRTKTWAELSKWHNMSLTRDLFTYCNSKGNMCIFNNEHPYSWRCDAMTCREENSEAFAGLHSANSTPFYLFDESSAIPEKIFEVAQGGLTDGEPMFFLFGNPTRNSGFFRETHGRLRNRWRTWRIDSRKVEGTNKELFSTWAEDYGEDSDFFKVRVRGDFPSAAVCQVIPSDYVDAALGRHIKDEVYRHMPVILGVDVARFGDDRSAIYKRQGLACWRLFEGRGLSVKQVSDKVAALARQHNPDAIFIDSGGVGGGVVDTCRESLGLDVIGIEFGSRAGDSRQFANKRSEMWWKMREWLGNGGCLPDNPELRDDLTGVEYQYKNEQQIQLESKKDMKKRGLASPDEGDAIALTFAMPVEKVQSVSSADSSRCETDYDMFDL